MISPTPTSSTTPGSPCAGCAARCARSPTCSRRIRRRASTGRPAGSPACSARSGSRCAGRPVRRPRRRGPRPVPRPGAAGAGRAGRTAGGGSPAAEDALRSERSAELLATILIWRNWPPLTEVADEPAGLIADRVRRARRKERKRVRQAIRSGAHDEELHRARKAAKRHRYALEIEAQAGAATGNRRRRSGRSRRSGPSAAGSCSGCSAGTRTPSSPPDSWTRPDWTGIPGRGPAARLIRREHDLADTRLGGGSSAPTRLIAGVEVPPVTVRICVPIPAGTGPNRQNAG